MRTLTAGYLDPIARNAKEKVPATVLFAFRAKVNYQQYEVKKQSCERYFFLEGGFAIYGEDNCGRYKVEIQSCDAMFWQKVGFAFCEEDNCGQ